MTNHPKSKGTRTLDLNPVPGEMLKPAELIDIDGATELTLMARRIYNQLIAHAFGPDMGEEGREWSVSLADLRGTHASNDRLTEAIVSLMKTIVTVRLPDGATRRVALLGGNDMGESGRQHGMLTYSFDPKLVPLLKESSVFGKLEVEVMRAFTTKYALALYEAVARRVRLKHKFKEDFELEAFRELMGVPPGKLSTWSNLKLRAVTPALTEVNAMAGFGVKIDPIKQGRRVTGCRIYWWLKDLEGVKEAYAELQRPRVGRKARLGGETEDVVEPGLLFGEE